MIKLNCFLCKKEFETYLSLKKGKKKFCSKECEIEYRKSKKLYIECKICHKKVYTKRSMSKKYKVQYCSRKCYGIAKRLKFSKHNGYNRIYAPYHPFTDCDGNIYEHRLVMEKHIGRFLKPTEEIHHINEIRDDNRIDNLKILSKAKHQSLHKKGKRHASKNKF